MGTEAVLRSQFHVKSSKSSKGPLATENTFIGFFNLLDWYQKLFLQLINTRIAAKRQRIVREAVRRVPREMSFDKLCNIVRINTDALDEKDKLAITDEIAKQLCDYSGEISSNGGLSTQDIESRYQYKLAYWIYNKAGRWHGLRVLFAF
jgi:hypothetical protein